MTTGAIALYEDALRQHAAALVLRTADGRALPLPVSRWRGESAHMGNQRLPRALCVDSLRFLSGAQGEAVRANAAARSASVSVAAAPRRSGAAAKVDQSVQES